MEALSTAGVFNVLNLFFGLGGLVTPLLAARLFQNNTQKLLVFAGGIIIAAAAIAGITEMPPPSGKVAFDPSQVGSLLGNTTLILLALTLFVYVAAEVGVWNWLVRHLMAQGLPEKKALTILSLGFALGLLLGRVGGVAHPHRRLSERVLSGAALLMVITTYLMLQSSNPGTAQILVFLAGIAMAPVFPTTLAIVSARFPDMAATATGIAVTAGWAGLVTSSPIIGGIAGDDPEVVEEGPAACLRRPLSCYWSASACKGDQ